MIKKDDTDVTSGATRNAVSGSGHMHEYKLGDEELANARNAKMRDARVSDSATCPENICRVSWFSIIEF
jgi:hypothetical protein